MISPKAGLSKPSLTRVEHNRIFYEIFPLDNQLLKEKGQLPQAGVCSSLYLCARCRVDWPA